MRDLVIGLAMNYTWEQIEPFACSLIQSGFAGKKVLFVNPDRDEAFENLRKLDFELIPLPHLEYAIREQSRAMFFPYVGRFLLLHRWLMEHQNEYRFVLSTDTRDVIFHHNPFTWMTHNLGDKQIVAAPEYILHQGEVNNMKWVDTCFTECPAWMLPKMIYCSGVIAATQEAMTDLSWNIYLVGRALSYFSWGADQPAYNATIHQKAYSDITLAPSFADNWCLNLAIFACGDRGLFVDTPPISADADGLPTFSQYSIVHQYDRFVDIAAKIRRQYCLQNL